MNRKFAGLFLTLALAVPVFALAQAGGAPQQPPAAQPQQQQPPAAQQPQRPVGPPPTRIGIMDSQAVIANTEEGRRDFEALEKRFEPKRSELQKLQAELEEMRNRLTTQGDKLNDEARARLARDIEQRERRLRTSFEEAQADFEAERNEIFSRVGSKLVAVINDFAEANGFVVILDVANPQSGVVWAAAASNVTPSLIDAYNARHPLAAGTQQPGGGQAQSSPQPAQQPRPQGGTPR